MAVPQIEDYFRAQVIFKGQSGKPEDVYVNTWHFRNNTGVDPAADILGVLMHFYDDYEAGREHLPITGLMPSSLIKPEGEIRVYDLADPAPREPVITPITWANLSATTAIPEEVAICMSFYGDRNIPRQRGRVFLGPLTTACYTIANGKTKVTDAVRARICGRATDLLDVADANPLHQVTWSVYSPTSNAAVSVTNGWCDDAMDTIRRRGPKASVRDLFPS